MRMGRVRFLLAILALLVLVPSCDNQNREFGYVYIRLKENPSTLDPALIASVDAGSIAAKMFNGLVRLGEGLEIVPDIADSWSISDDGLTYTFALNNGVTFSSGRQVRASDFKYSFERVLLPETRSPNTWVFENIKGADKFINGEVDDLEGIRAPDASTLVIV